jgi:methionyl-tRNA formyltransferase
MRIVFMGTPDFAVPSLEILLQNGCSVVGVMTVPDKPAGRGQSINESPVKIFARERNLLLLQPEDLRDPSLLAQLRALSPDLFVVVAFRILPPELYTIPPRGAFNLHASILPKYRGAAPINWAIIRGERETGVTTFFLEEKVDTGNLILQARLPIGENETAGELHDRLAAIGAEIVMHTVRLIERGSLTPQKQDESGATAAPKIFKDDCRIDWAKNARDVHNFIRGLSPRPGAFTVHRGVQWKIYRSQCREESSAGAPGSVGVGLRVQCGRGSVEILELQQAGKRRMSGEEFLRGYTLPPDQILG